MKKIKDIHRVERPREKMKRYGSDKLSDDELLAILLGSGTKGMNVKLLAKMVLKRVKEIGVSSISVDHLRDIRGLGAVKCQQIIALFALAARLHEGSHQEILTNKDVWNLCNDFYSSSQEHLVAFYLNTRSRLLERRIIFKGTLNESVAHPREIFEPALELRSATIIVVHNHPSGDLDPSDSDISFTCGLIKAGRTLGIPIQDHLVVTSAGFLSMREEGVVDF